MFSLSVECSVEVDVFSSLGSHGFLNYLDVNCLGDESCNPICDLDVNDPDDQIYIIKVLMGSGFLSASDGIEEYMTQVLDELPIYPESEVRAVIAYFEMPFEQPLDNYNAFFNRVRQYFFSDSSIYREKATKFGSARFVGLPAHPKNLSSLSPDSVSLSEKVDLFSCLMGCGK